MSFQNNSLLRGSRISLQGQNLPVRSCRKQEDLPPCPTGGCLRRASLWSELEQRPYCVACWNAGRNHFPMQVKLRQEKVAETTDFVVVARRNPKKLPGKLLLGTTRTERPNSTPNTNALTREIRTAVLVEKAVEGQNRRTVSVRSPQPSASSVKILGLTGNEPSRKPPEFAIPHQPSSTILS